jgi:hypothetical protein
MHPFPPSDGLKSLIGLTTTQIALDPFSLQFRFADDGQITVEGRMEHVDAGGVTHSYDCQQRASCALYLHQLLEQSITAVETEPYCLSLTFNGGAILRIFTDLSRFECGQIVIAKENLLIVF